jgi:hypothetical protein
MTPPDGISEGDSILFEMLHEQTAPTISWDDSAEETSGCSPGCADVAAGDAAGGALGSGENGVHIYATGSTAHYDYAVVGGDDGGNIGIWLEDNGFVIPSEYESALDTYVDGGWIFLVARVSEGALEEGDGATLAPLVLEYPAFPAHLLDMPFAMASYSLAPEATLGVTLYMVGPTMVVPEEPVVKIDSADIEVEDGETNYEALVAEASHGSSGHAWVLEYSQDGWDPESRLTLLEGEPGWEPTASEQWLIDFAHGLGTGPVRLTRLRTEYDANELADLGFRETDPEDVDGTLHADAAIDSSGPGLPIMGNLLILIPLLVVRRRRRG